MVASEASLATSKALYGSGGSGDSMIEQANGRRGSGGW